MGMMPDNIMARVDKALAISVALKKYEKMCKAGMRDIFAHW